MSYKRLVISIEFHQIFASTQLNNNQALYQHLQTLQPTFNLMLPNKTGFILLYYRCQTYTDKR